MIETENLTKEFGSTVALDGLTLTLEQGDMFGYIGPNGAGKSTTMKLLACLMRPNSGSARVCGLDCATESDAIRARIGYMPDFLGVYHDLKVEEYLHFFGAAYGLRRGKRRAIVNDVLELTDLTGKREAMVDSLSRGMQQRLGIARVLIHDPEVLLLDEPASGLDPRARIEMRSLLMELGRMGKTIMISSHILSELHEMCNTIGILETGQLVFSGSIEEAVRKSGLHGLIELEVDQADRATIVLQQSGLISSCQQVNGKLVITLTDESEADNQAGTTAIPKVLVGAGIGIRSIRPQSVNLEDVFLRLTTGAVN
ncbi:MAG: ABC transporter ATP-binding protein [Planctomycetes bacterium]|nr:ABC transporter ATP-binding protein [Planctomycetota bacterium]NOG53289.1 ABC transporter ATP-binding protein [Planctomycetota bacterium]